MHRSRVLECARLPFWFRLFLHVPSRDDGAAKKKQHLFSESFRHDFTNQPTNKNRVASLALAASRSPSM
jgi:hypothetical protein